MKQTFSKAERLNSKKIINQLFEKGSEKTDSVFLYPFRVVYLTQQNPQIRLVSIIISVSKRSFKKAVDRNLIKRRIREAYRLNKNLIYKIESSIFPLNIAFVYVGKEILPFSSIESKMISVLEKIAKSCKERAI
jgi:ribonuclease P protein component